MDEVLSQDDSEDDQVLSSSGLWQPVLEGVARRLGPPWDPTIAVRKGLLPLLSPDGISEGLLAEEGHQNEAPRLLEVQSAKRVMQSACTDEGEAGGMELVEDLLFLWRATTGAEEQACCLDACEDRQPQ